MFMNEYWGVSFKKKNKTFVNVGIVKCYFFSFPTFVGIFRSNLCFKNSFSCGQITVFPNKRQKIV